MKHKTAFLFAGQGAQFVGMGRDFFSGEKGGIYDIMANGPAEELNRTVNAQPAIYLHDMAVAEELLYRGVVPDCAAGFSLGEIPALVFAKVMRPVVGLEFVSLRAEAMQRACDNNPSAMLAVLKLPAEKVERLAEKFQDVWVANYNAPEQVVCSCSLTVLEAFSNAVAEAGGRTLKLKVSGGFHSPLMYEARGVIEGWLLNEAGELRSAKMPVYSNWTGQPYVHDYKDRLALQIQSPVLWQDIIENMLADGVRIFIEVGPGTVLAGLVKKIVEHNDIEGAKIFSASNMAGIVEVVSELGI